ncbi:hypothetical protein [uncultured Oscillibacter sp.]|uniref:hypothetical protein n=1 Tax=uncultured Oscillibacter sp. TaxID=876091 RepID=UPI00263492BE|nr:hypothetical protein [uncultured Oscillibacter sp.]
MKNLKEPRRPILGAGVILTAFLLISPAFAAAGQVSFNQAGVRLFGEPKVAVGESYKASNGQEVPSTITYTDAAGGKTNYLSVRQISKLLDAEIAWNAEENAVDIAPRADGTGWVNLELSGEIKLVRPPESDLIKVTEEPAETSKKVEYGVTHGAFQEIDPATVDTSGEPSGIFMQDTRVTSAGIGFPAAAYDFHPAAGKHVVFQVKNNGTAAQTVKVDRVTTIADNRTEPFTRVTLAPGETLTRAFSISSDSSRLERTLKFGVIPSDLGTGTDVTVSLMQYK